MVTSMLVFGAAVGFMMALAVALTAIDRRFHGGPAPAPRRRRVRLSGHAGRTRHAAGARRVTRVGRIGPRTPRRPIQVVAADVRRLSRELASVPAGAPLVRWKALWVAYDRVLMEAADLLDVSHTLPGMPIGTPRDIERLRVVCALEAAGLVVQG